MFSKQTILPVHSHAFNSLTFTLLYENLKRFLNLTDALPAITKLWEAELLDSLILINVVPEISIVVGSLGHF